jgi:hypothetical protein
LKIIQQVQPEFRNSGFDDLSNKVDQLRELIFVEKKVDLVQK